ncbi:MAG TPA: TatD family hydrolase [Tepidiformaceae bacterium]|nr:TatD family hydrolase [Tepidiformaceae bacterium]
MTAPAFDTHCHLQDSRLLADLDGVLARAEQERVLGMALCGYDAPSNTLVLELAERSPALFPTVGFHPHEADDVTPGMLAELDALARLPQVVAIGEIGLDNYRHHSTAANQRRLLDAQLEIALRVRKPACVHSRMAEDEISGNLAPFAAAARAQGMAVPGVMHCFGGTLEQALRYVELGFVISIAAPITYPKNEESRRLARGLPAGSLVIETDSPYLPPQPMRGKLNEPSLVLHTARAIAAARGESPGQVLEYTTANAERLFGVRVAEAAGSR